MHHRIFTWGIVAFAVAIFSGTAVAMQAIQLNFRSLDGEEVRLDKNHGRILALVFGSTKSPMSNKSLPSLQRVADFYQGRDVDFYWVCIDSDNTDEKYHISDSNLRAFARDNGMQITILRDADRKVFHAFGFNALPSIVIIDRKGSVYQKHLGFNIEQPQGFSIIMKSLNELFSQSSI